MTRTKRLGTMAAVVALVAVLAACGGDDDGGTGATEAAGDGGGGATEVTVGMTEFAFDPADVSAAAGAEVTVTAENRGSIEHDWVVLGQGSEIAAEADLPEDLDAFRSDAVASLHADPGASDTATFTAPAAGTYQIVCLVPGHFSAGMEGALTVGG